MTDRSSYTYKNVSSKASVKEAIKEFDLIGRENFLEKYDFDKARSYFLIYKGKRYDCKPILWAAFEYQFGFPLLRRASGGVNNTVRPHLESLGFVVIGNNETLEEIITELDESVKISSTLTHKQRLERLANAPKTPKKLSVTTYAFLRNPDVISERLFLAKGICDLCKKPAPFKKVTDGKPYLEVHHIKSLASGGDDTVENTHALCPNCHRKCHFG